MKLVIAIVQSADSGRLIDGLVAKGFRSTRINTVGGFLDEPNVTMLIGTEDEELPDLIPIIKQNCRARRRYMNAAPLSVETAGMPVMSAAPIEVEVGGAAVFTLPVRHIARLGKAMPLTPSGVTGEQGVLMVAVMQADNTNAVSAALSKANYRFTRINSTGGFLKKGNTTLFMGVRGDHVDEALAVMDAACRQRSEPSAVKAGLPSYAVTVFIIDMIPLPGLV